MELSTAGLKRSARCIFYLSYIRVVTCFISDCIVSVLYISSALS